MRLNRSGSWHYLARVAGLQASLLALYEVIRSVRSAQWSGFDITNLTGLTLALLLYFVVLVALAAGALCLLRRVPSRIPQTGCLALSNLLAGLLLGALLLVHSQEFSLRGGLLVLAALLFPCLLHCLPDVLHRIVGSTGLWGICGALIVSMFCLLHVDRSSLVLYGAASAMLMGMLCEFYYERVSFHKATRLLLMLAPLLAFLVLKSVSHPPVSTPQRPHVVWIIADTLRAQDMALYGGKVETPHLAKLAERGVLFERHYALAPWTLPSMTGMFSSQYPPGLSAHATQEHWEKQLWRYRVPDGMASPQKRFKEAGYRTVSLSANPVLWGIPGLTEDFDTRATAHPLLLKRAGIFEMNPLLQSVLARHLPAWAPLRPHDTTDTLTKYFAAALHNFSNKPLFVWLHYMDPHTPYAPPGAPPAPGVGWPFFFPYRGGEQWGQPVLGDHDFLISPELRPWVEELYRREIQHVDAFVGTVLHRLESFGILKNTVVCFTSDHGEEFWEHGDWGHGQSLYNEQLHVPLILAGPGIPALRIEQPVSAVSVLPTLAELAGLQGDATWRGQSLAAFWSEPGIKSSEPIFAQGTSNRSLLGPQQMVIEWPFKLIRRLAHEGQQLYRLDMDPNETRNLIDEEDEKSIQLNRLLDSWQESFEHTLPMNGEHGETLEKLESMGYL